MEDVCQWVGGILEEDSTGDQAHPHTAVGVTERHCGAQQISSEESTRLHHLCCQMIRNAVVTGESLLAVKEVQIVSQ